MTATEKTTKFPTTLLLIVASLVPCVLSIGFATHPTEAPALNSTKLRPALHFATYLYHHGHQPVALDATLESEFRFRNFGREPVTIGTIERSCGCMAPQLSQREIAPGEQGSIYVPIQTMYQSPGAKEYTLTVHYNDPKPREVTLGIKATFPEKMVVVQPKALYLSQRSEKSAPFDVTINDFREQTLKVKSVESTAAFVSAELASQSSSQIVQTAYEEGEVSAVRAKIKGEIAGGIPPGHHHALVVAHTDDPEFAVVTVPMVINGPAYPEGEAPVVSPPQIRLDAVDHPKARRKARVQVVVPSKWKISHANTWPEQLTVDYGVPQKFTDTEVMIPVEVLLAELPEHRVVDGIVQLIANDGKNLVTIRASLRWP